jgi:circadian clock protein KaiB
MSAEASLVLFVTGDAPRSRRARANLAAALAGRGLDPADVREIDLLREPERTVEYGIFATPALLQVTESGPGTVLYGDLSETERLERFLAETA